MEMKKIIALLLVLVLAFSAVSVICYAADGTGTELTEEVGGHGHTDNDEEYEEAYSLLNLLTDLFNRLNILIEYFVTVFFPDFATA